MGRNRHSFARASALVVLLGAAGLLSPGSSAERIRGITISTHTSGQDWAHDSIVPTLERIKHLGANWVTIHPYARIEHDGRVRFHEIDPANPPQHIVRPIREAHALGLKIFIKPHLAYWGSPFDWRGEIAFDEQADWDRFWADYERWIVGVARVSRDADGFAVGTELTGTLDQQARWRRVIATVREVSPAPLTYAANWSEFAEVPFWDALDVIGVQAYFPLTESEGAGPAAIEHGWQTWMRRLREFSERHDRPIVFTELGYSRSSAASVRPWEPRMDDDDGARAVQEACMRAALRAVEQEPAVIGAFLWKWFPEPRPVGRNFRLATPRMQNLIRGIWAAGAP